MHRIAARPEPATAQRYSFDDHGAHSGTGFARVLRKCIAWAGALAAPTCERGRAHHRRICLVTSGAGSAASLVCKRGAMWLRIVMHRVTDRRTELARRLTSTRCMRLRSSASAVARRGRRTNSAARFDYHAGHRAVEVLSSALRCNASAALVSPRLWWSPPLMTLAPRLKAHARSVAVCEFYSGGL
jgi:hypothetical protein